MLGEGANGAENGGFQEGLAEYYLNAFSKLRRK